MLNDSIFVVFFGLCFIVASLFAAELWTGHVSNVHQEAQYDR